MSFSPPRSFISSFFPSFFHPKNVSPPPSRYSPIKSLAIVSENEKRVYNKRQESKKIYNFYTTVLPTVLHRLCKMISQFVPIVLFYTATTS